MKLQASLVVLILAFCFTRVQGQNTEFSYQGQMQNSAALANGVFDFEFALFGSALGGGQLGPTQTRNGVNVVNGIFSVALDFGNQFDGTARFLEIRVRQSGGGAFTTLSPRQGIASSPYAVRSLDSQNSVNAQTAANATNAVNATNAANFTGPLAGDVTGTQGATSVARLRGTNVAATAPTNGQVLKFNSGTNQWQPDTDNTGSGGGGTITGVTAGTGLTGGGTTGTVTVGIANGGVGQNEIAGNAVTALKIADNSIISSKILDGAVTDPKIATGNVVKSINSLKDNVTLAAGTNVTITPSGNTLTIASTGGTVNAILNQTTQQPGANFNISGNGTAGGTLAGNLVNTATHFSFNGNRILGTPGIGNLFGGINAGLGSTTGQRNTYLGANAGESDIVGADNTFVGFEAGKLNLGSASTGNGKSNTFVGSSAGAANVSGGGNSYFGAVAGSQATGSGNTFIGYTAGSTNMNGVANTLLGAFTNASANVVGSTAIGSCSIVEQNNSIVLGTAAGNACAGGPVTNVGIGTTTPQTRLHVVGDTGLIGNVGIGTTTPSAKLSIIASGDGTKVLHLGTERAWVFKQFSTGAATALELTADDAANNNKNFVINTQGNVGVGTQGPLDKLHVVGDIRVGVVGTNGCLKNNNGGTIIGTCSSDLRFKRDIIDLEGVLDRVTRLQPKYFYWRASEFAGRGFGPMRETGLIAQDVETVFPELVVTDDQGYKAVDYSRLPLLAIQAIKEQQTQINVQRESLVAQKNENRRLRTELDELKAVVCSIRPRTRICH